MWLKALLPTEYAISASIIIDCRIQKKDWRMFRSDQMSLVVPLCGAECTFGVHGYDMAQFSFYECANDTHNLDARSPMWQAGLLV